MHPYACKLSAPSWPTTERDWITPSGLFVNSLVLLHRRSNSPLSLTPHRHDHITVASFPVTARPEFESRSRFFEIKLNGIVIHSPEEVN